MGQTMREDYIDTFLTTLDSIPLFVRYGVDSEDGSLYLIHVLTRSDDDLMGILSKEAIAELEAKAERAYEKSLKQWNDDALIARKGE